MQTRLYRYLVLACIVLTAAVGPLGGALAQGDGRPYSSPALGIAFDLPAGWEVAVEDNRLAAAAPDDLAALTSGTAPAGLSLRIVIGTFNELGIVEATDLPGLLARLVPGSASAPEPTPAQWGNSSGYEILVTLPSEGITTRVGLLAVAGGRVAVVRGMAPSAAWDSGAGATFDALVSSLNFTLPERDEALIDSITANDGGVLWHFQTAQPGDWRVVQAGGITFDPYDVMYMVVGPGGVLAINMSTGEQISYMGPWAEGDFVDVVMSPNLRLYMANAADDTDTAITMVDRAGNYGGGWGTRGDGEGQFAPGMPQTLAFAPDGSLWAVSEGHASGIRNRLYQFDTVGNLLRTVDLDAINPDLSGIRLDINPRSGTMYLIGATGNLNVVDADGQPLVKNLAAEIFVDVTPTDIAIAPSDNIIIALEAPGLDGYGLLEMSVSGRLLDAFGYPHDASQGRGFLPGEYQRPAGLTVGPDGTIYWTETDPATGSTQVQRFTFTGDGRLPLGSEQAASPDDPMTVLGADPAQGGGPIGYGQSVRGALNNRYPAHSWTFEGRAGDHVIITMVDPSGAGLLDPKLALRDPQDRVIAANDDVGTNPPEGMTQRDARIDFFLPTTATFTIEAGRFGGRGDYILTLEQVAAE